MSQYDAHVRKLYQPLSLQLATPHLDFPPESAWSLLAFLPNSVQTSRLKLKKKDSKRGIGSPLDKTG